MTQETRCSRKRPLKGASRSSIRELGGHFAESFLGKLQKQAIGKEGLEKRWNDWQRSQPYLPRDQSVGGQLKEFGHGFEIPIGIGHMDVP